MGHDVQSHQNTAYVPNNVSLFASLDLKAGSCIKVNKNFVE